MKTRVEMSLRKRVDVLVRGRDLEALRDQFLRHLRRLHRLGRFTWRFPDGSTEDLETYGFPSGRPEIIVAAANWGHYVSVLVNVPQIVTGERPTVEIDTPVAEVYLPKRLPNWRPNFVFCAAGSDQVEARCYGRFRIGARNQSASKFFRFIRQNGSTLSGGRDWKGREYISLATFSVRDPHAWTDFWRQLARLAALARAYKGRG